MVVLVLEKKKGERGERVLFKCKKRGNYRVGVLWQKKGSLGRIWTL